MSDDTILPVIMSMTAFLFCILFICGMLNLRPVTAEEEFNIFSTKAEESAEKPADKENESNWKKYRSEKLGFLFSYPKEAEIQTEISGGKGVVRLKLPVSKDTLLQEKIFLVKTTPNYGNYQNFLPEESKGKTVFVNGKRFTKMGRLEGAAGHIYEHVMYLRIESKRYYVLDCILHSVNPGVFESPPPNFPQNERDIFEKIIATFEFIDPKP